MNMNLLKHLMKFDVYTTSTRTLSDIGLPYVIKYIEAVPGSPFSV